jgi:hypothetical protein
MGRLELTRRRVLHGLGATSLAGVAMSPAAPASAAVPAPT